MVLFYGAVLHKVEKGFFGRVSTSFSLRFSWCYASKGCFEGSCMACDQGSGFSAVCCFGFGG